MAVNLKGKKTSLDESALIYSKRDNRLSEKQKWKNMSPREKCSYFSAYYLPKLLIIVAVAALAGYILWTDFINKTNIYFRCAVINEGILDSSFEKLDDEFTASLGLDADKNSASFYCYYTKMDTASQIGANAAGDISEITSRIVANMLGGIIADENDGKQYREHGFFLDLKQFLTEDEYTALKPYLYFADTEDGGSAAYGVYLSESPVYQALHSGQSAVASIEKPIFSIVTNSDDESKAYAKKLLFYFFPDVI